MPASKGVWGIDIGQCALKAIRLELIDGRPVATAFDLVEHPKILSQPDADPDVLIREALEKFLSRNEVKNDEVAIGIAGQSGLARFVKLPPVEEKKIAEIVKFEAKQQIPFPLDEVVWAFQKIAGGEVTDGFAMETEIGLFAMKRDVISRYMGYFNSARIEVHTVQMSPLALVNYATYEVLKKGGTLPAATDPDEAQPEPGPRGKKPCVVVLDIGTEASNLIITDGGKVIWQRPIPLGGNNFTRALTKELKLTFAKAEHLKRNAAKSPELPQILKALKPVLTDFVGEVQRSLGYFTNTHRDAHVTHMVGLGSAFRLPGLQKYLAEKLTLEVKKPDRLARVTGDAVLNDPLFKENVLTFPVAYGLALQGLGEARLATNLIPREIVVDRQIRAKKPFAAAAAAMLLIGLGFLTVGYSIVHAAAYDPRSDQADKETKSAMSDGDSSTSAADAKLGEVKGTAAQAAAVISGNTERLNWPRAQEVFSAALPRPGSKGNLAPELWERPTEEVQTPAGKVAVNGKDATAWFERRLKNGLDRDARTGGLVDPAGDESSPNLRVLGMVNVEYVYCRWVHKTGDFLTAADLAVQTEAKVSIGNSYLRPDEVEDDPSRPNRKKPKPPTLAAGQPDGAWVIEVRGYTYHRDGEQFIKKALVGNIQRMDAFVQERQPDKVGKYLTGVDDPLRDKDPADPEGKKFRSRVSHVFIYNVWSAFDPQPGQFLFINQSYLDPLVGGSQQNGLGGQLGGGGPRPVGPMGPVGPEGSPDPMSGGGQPAAQMPLAAPWSPVNGSGTTGSGLIGGGPLASGSGGGGPRGGPMGSGPMPSPMGGPMGTTTTTTTTEKKDVRQRFEFVVMFLWREPAQKIADDAPAPTTGGPEGPGGPGGVNTGGRGG